MPSSSATKHRPWRCIFCIDAVSPHVPGPKLINMFHSGWTPLVPVERLAELDYRLVIIPSDLQRAAIRALQRTLQEIALTGDSGRIADELASFGEREAIVRTARYLALDIHTESTQ